MLNLVLLQPGMLKSAVPMQNVIAVRAITAPLPPSHRMHNLKLLYRKLAWRRHGFAPFRTPLSRRRVWLSMLLHDIPTELHTYGLECLQ